MSVEENKALVRRVFSLASRGDEAYFDLYAPGYVGHIGERIQSLEDERKLGRDVGSAFSDVVGTVEDMVAEGDKVAYRITWRLTHTGEFMGIAPTGKRYTWTYLAMYRIAGGKLAEWWVHGDSIMQQLGVVVPREE